MANNNTLLCLIEEGIYKHPIFYISGSKHTLLGYCPIEKLSEELTAYSGIYDTKEVFLEGNRDFLIGVKEIISHNNILKYGNNNLNIKITGDN